MYRRLVAFALLVVTVAVTALVTPLALSARDLVRAGNLAVLADEARILADSWESLADDDVGGAPVVDLPGDPGEVILVYPGGTVVGGPVPGDAAGVVDRARTGRSAAVDSGSAGYAAAPATFGQRSAGVILSVADAQRMNEGLGARLAALAALCAALLAGAGVAAWLLARRTARPIREVARTADEIAAGDLTGRGPGTTRAG